MRVRAIGSLVGVALMAFALSGCAGSSPEGTYIGTAGDTMLILAPDGKCAYTQDWGGDPKEILELDEECSWTISDKTVTLANYSSKGNTIQGVVSDNGDISFPDQGSWNGEIYTKQ